MRQISYFPFLMTALLAAGLLLVGCEREPDPLAIPDSYDGSAFTTNAATELVVLDQLGALVSALKEGRDSTVTIDAAELKALYEAGSPSVKDITTSYYAAKVEEWLDGAAAESGKPYDYNNAPSSGGGALAGYLLSPGGVEYEQLVEKGLFGAALYNHAITVMEDELDETTPDKLLAIIGAHPDFANSDNSNLHDNADAFMAKYVARRDQADGNGFYSDMQTALITLQAAIAAGEDYTTDRDQAIEDYWQAWDKANAATVINYCQSTISKLSATTLPPSTVGSGLHSYSEGVGFLHGWKTIPTNYRTISDAEIDAMLVLMNAPADADATAYLFATDAFNALPQLQQVIDQLQTAYGFTDDEVEAFRTNWPSQQGR